jgi:mono/diheme cytochrome c family protein
MKQNSRLVLIWVCVLAALVAACSSAAAPTAPTATSASASSVGAAGAEDLFVNNCAKCHGLGGLGDGPSVGSLRTQAGLNLTILKDKTDDELYETISVGKGSDMPPWELVFTKEQRQALVQYVRTLQK